MYKNVGVFHALSDDIKFYENIALSWCINGINLVIMHL